VVTAREPGPLLLQRLSTLRRQLLAVALSCGLLSPASAWSQTAEELARLVFEPFPLPMATTDTSLPAQGALISNAPPLNSTEPEQPVSLNPSVSTAAIEVAEPSAEVMALINADIARYEDSISALIAVENPYSENLREQYAALGQLLQRAGDFEGSIEVLEKAMHIGRVNQGLFTIEQIPLVESIIASQTELGNYSEVDDYHEYLYYIQQKTYPEGDPRLLAAKERWADWSVESYLRQGLSRGTGNVAGNASLEYVAIQHPTNGSYNYVPRNQLPNILSLQAVSNNGAFGDLYNRSTPFAVSPELLVDKRLRKARELYEEIREDRSTQGSANQDYAVEHKLANIAYAVKAQMEEIEAASNSGSLGYNRPMQQRRPNQLVSREYAKNRDSLEKIAGQLAQDPDSTSMEIANAWLYLGDWQIAFGYTARAEQAYQQAWDVLAAADANPDLMNRVLAPAPLLPVPAFAIHPYSRALVGIAPDASLDYQGYMDVTLSINRNGSISAPRIDQTSEGTSQQLRSKLLDFLRDTKVRPPLDAGKPVGQKELKLRYYYAY